MKIEEVVTKIVSDEVGSLAAMTVNEFKKVHKKFDEIEEKMVTKEELEDIKKIMATKEDIRDMATKHDIKEILEHIGRYEIRTQNVENILLQDYKPRIADLEKEVFA